MTETTASLQPQFNSIQSSFIPFISRSFKRACDVNASFWGLLFLSPFLLFIAILLLPLLGAVAGPRRGDLRGLDALGPLGIGLEVRDDGHHVGRRSVDRDRRGGLFGHGRSLAHGTAAARTSCRKRL